MKRLAGARYCYLKNHLIDKCYIRSPESEQHTRECVEGWKGRLERN